MNRQFGSNLDEYGFERYEENAFPVAYLITFRTYGTWLHGDQRTSMQRSRDKRFRTLRLAPNVPLEEKMSAEMKTATVILTEQQRGLVDGAIREACGFRNFRMRACNVRLNHVHVVVSAAAGPDKIASTLKAYSTRRLRESGQFPPDQRIWARGASTKYLWKPRYVDAAIEYVLYSQGDVPFETVFGLSDK